MSGTTERPNSKTSSTRTTDRKTVVAPKPEDALDVFPDMLEEVLLLAATGRSGGVIAEGGLMSELPLAHWPKHIKC